MIVSIVVPTCNTKPEWLTKCLGSIHAQTYKDIELIVIDDPQASGASAARNRGIDKATGKYIVFVDADDYLEPEAISRLVKAIVDVDMVAAGFNKVGTVQALKTTVTAETRFYTKQMLSAYVMFNLYNPRRYQMLNGCWAKMFRTSIIRAHNIRFPGHQRTAEDMSFNYTYLTHCNAVRFISDAVYNNRKHAAYDSLSTRFNPEEPFALFGFVQGFEAMRAFLRGSIAELEIDRAVGHAYIYHMILYFIRICGQSTDKFVRALLESKMTGPEFRRYLGYYRPASGNYRLIPALLRLGWLTPIMLACRLEARRLYK